MHRPRPVTAVRRSPATLALVIGLVAACAGTLPASSEPPRPLESPPALTPPASAVPAVERTPWEAEVAAVMPGETRSLESALKLMAMAFGPVPGVDAPSDPGIILSADAAVRGISEHLDALTPEQRSVVEGYIALPTDGERYEVGPADTALGRTPIDTAQAPVGLIRAQRTIAHEPGSGGGRTTGAAIVADVVRELRAKLAQRWRDFPGSVAVVFTDEAYNSLSYSLPAFGGAYGSFTGCNLVVTALGRAAGDEQLRFSLAHDIFHCAQSAVVNSAYSRFATPAWVWDGQARLFAHDADFYSDSGSRDGAWRVYMTTPDVPLFTRAEDAVGFWGHLGYVFGDPYASMAAALADGGDEERFVEAGADDAAFLDTWASGLFRNALLWSGAPGRAWNTDGAGLSPVLSAPRASLPVAESEVQLVEQAAYSNRLYIVEARAGRLQVEFEGHARMATGGGDGATFDSTELGSVTFCFTDEGCKPCPGDAAADAPLRLDSPSIVLAVSGGRDGTRGSMTGSNRLCPTPSPTPSPTPPSPTPENEFCRRYRALVAWGKNPTEPELTRPWAQYLHDAGVDLYEVAPPEMVDHVGAFVAAYGIYAGVADPANVPLSGPVAAQLGEAIPAMHRYCDIPM